MAHRTEEPVQVGYTENDGEGTNFEIILKVNTSGGTVKAENVNLWLKRQIKSLCLLREPQVIMDLINHPVLKAKILLLKLIQYIGDCLRKII